MIIIRVNGTKQGRYGETFTGKRLVANNMITLFQEINRIENYTWYETKIEILDIIGAEPEDLKAYADWLRAHGYWFEWVE